MAKDNIISIFKVVLLVQLFFAFAITTIAYAMPSSAKHHIDSWSDLSDRINLTSVSEDVSDGLEQQTNIPILDIGALIFYSGNILIDLILNFAFAIPEMLGLIIFGISRLIELDPQIIVIVQSFTSVAVLVMYFLSVIQLLTGLRTGRVV